MNPLTQQHIIHITVSGRGGEEREAGETVGSIYGEQAERQYCKSGGKKTCRRRRVVELQRETNERGQRTMKAMEIERDG